MLAGSLLHAEVLPPDTLKVVVIRRMTLCAR